jgi:malonyl-CoA O-methyltransferase
MSTERPPTIDPQAASRWQLSARTQSPWLHEEVARRMEDRLQWIVQHPKLWVHWEPLRGGLEAQVLLSKRYPKSECFMLESTVEQAQTAIKSIAVPWWNPARWTAAPVHLEEPQMPVQMVWANMALHMAADPQALMARWHGLLAPDGFLMFSCFGPDTLRELRSIYADNGWPPPAHEFTDMHDWGDMLAHAGFAEPVMDMERITLSFSSPESLLSELRGLGRNLHPARFSGLRGKTWRNTLHSTMSRELASPQDQGRLKLTFEIIYGHAFKPQPRLPVQAQTTVSLDEMRKALRQGKP